MFFSSYNYASMVTNLNYFLFCPGGVCRLQRGGPDQQASDARQLTRRVHAVGEWSSGLILEVAKAGLLQPHFQYTMAHNLCHLLFFCRKIGDTGMFV